MDETAVIVIVAVVVVLIAALAWWYAAHRRRAALQDRFGPEYERTVADADNRRQAEIDLRDRERRRDELNIVPLDDASREQFAAEWHDVQARFVDQPAETVIEADALVMRVMRRRGYPIDDFEQRAADISVDHPDIVEHYRAGHALADRSRAGDSDTESLREAVLHYRELFSRLLDDRVDAGR
jgi:hypothetical protein